MIKPEDIKLFHDVVSGAKRLVSNVAKHEPFKGRIPIRDVSIKTKLDLHGYTVHQAYDETCRFLGKAYAANLKYVTVITGLSGQIRSEFPDWFKNISYVREVKSINGGGAFKVIFAKKKNLFR